mmetsp:Transcript_92887/g.277159  ORF Transcript_92887/g.277159 Transcript_92887/m.277159 type:complete len:231 (+) Transcript_92887:200-892(+)
MPSVQRKRCRTARWMACRSGLNGPRAPSRRRVPGRSSSSRLSTSSSGELSTGWRNTSRRRAIPSSRLSWSARHRGACLHSSFSPARQTTSTTAGGRTPSRRATTSESGAPSCSRSARAAPGGGRRPATPTPTRGGAQTSPRLHRRPCARPRCPRRPRPPRSPCRGRREASRWASRPRGRRRTLWRSASASAWRRRRRRSAKSATATGRAWREASGSATLTGTGWSSCSAV